MIYTAAQAYDLQELVNLVNGLIEQGYEPHGSLSVHVMRPHAFTNPDCLYTQAMVKREQESRSEPDSD